MNNDTAPHPSAESPDHRSTVAELSHDFRLANARLARRLRQEQAQNELSPSQFSALGTLFVEGAQTLSQLSERDRVTPPSMNRTVNALVAAGLVHRAQAHDDARKVTLTATNAGLELMRETRKRREAWLARRLEHLTPEQLRVLSEATSIMKELADS
ncbi:MAG: MarR family transcriptional regulator [Cryobacterium sp.]